MFIKLDIESLLLDSVPPDDDFLDLIDQAFLEGQIDGETMEWTYQWLAIHLPHCDLNGVYV